MTDHRELLRECLLYIESVCRTSAIENNAVRYNKATLLRKGIEAALAQPKAAPTDPIVVKEQLDCKIPGVSASVVITESGMATIRKALAESAASASGIICSKHGVQNGSICPICHPASGMPVASQADVDCRLLDELVNWCRGHENAMQGLKRGYIAERLEAIRAALSLRERGWKMTPREPTEEMLAQVMDLNVVDIAAERKYCVDNWQAMWETAPAAGEGKE